MMTELNAIEQKYNFQFPDLYHKLYLDKMLDWGVTGPNWYKETYPQLKKNPPLLLHANDFELLEFSAIEREIEEMKDPDDYRKIAPRFLFIPFGQTGGGDLYVFHYDIQNGNDVPVTLLYHDEENGVVLAKNLQDFIFRQLLEVVTEIDEYSSIIKGGDKSNAFHILRTHQPYLTKKQAEILTEIYNRDLFEYIPVGYKYKVTGLITFDECEKILLDEIGFDKLDDEFKYMG